MIGKMLEDAKYWNFIEHWKKDGYLHLKKQFALFELILNQNLFIHYKV